MQLTTREKILKANRYGLRNQDYASWHTGIYQVACDLGCDGIDLSQQPDVTAWRRGNLPAGGISINHATGDSERGLSVMAIGDNDAHWSEMFSGDRCRVDVRGMLLPYTGSDDEPLLLAYDIEDMDN
jgi:hypothetical protein